MKVSAFFERNYWILVALVAIFLVNIAANLFYTRIDLTEDKRFTLTEASKEVVRHLDQPLVVQVLLEGTFPAEFRRLPSAVNELLRDFRKINSDFQYLFEDPFAGKPEDVKVRMEEWAKVGLVPTTLNARDSEGQTTKRIYPYAIFNYGERQVAINLLEQPTTGVSPDVALTNSISLLEYKFANAIAKLQATDKPNILFTEGHNELTEIEIASFDANLRAFYNTGRVNLDSIYQISSDIDMVIVAKPTKAFSDKNLFVLDQYLMNGGHLMFLIDPLMVTLDSVQKHAQYIAHDNDVGLDDLLFRYGARVNKNYVLDLECASIPLGVNKAGSQSGLQLFPWYYFPLVTGAPEHPIVRGLDRIKLQFPASIDTVKTKANITKTPLLWSSNYTRVQFNPVLLDFEILKTEPDPNKFGENNKTVALLLQGEFLSLYENRVSSTMLEGLRQIDADFVSQGLGGSVMVVSDGDIARNYVNPNTGQVRRLGYDQYMNYTFANLDFLTNSVEYMLDRNGLSQAKGKMVKLRLLDRPRIEQDRLYWQLLNVVLPIVLLALLGVIMHLVRRHQFART